jgi:hypothetical protein
MIHGLVNNNRQNHLYYGKSPLCPICHQEEETLRHVFSCPSLEAVHHRQNSLADLKKTLTSISTPQPVIDAMGLHPTGRVVGLEVPILRVVG